MGSLSVNLAWSQTLVISMLAYYRTHSWALCCFAIVSEMVLCLFLRSNGLGLSTSSCERLGQTSYFAACSDVFNRLSSHNSARISFDWTLLLLREVTTGLNYFWCDIGRLVHDFDSLRSMDSSRTKWLRYVRTFLLSSLLKRSSVAGHASDFVNVESWSMDSFAFHVFLLCCCYKCYHDQLSS